MWWTSCWRPGRSPSHEPKSTPQLKEPSAHGRQPTAQTAVSDGSVRGSASEVRSSGASKEAEQVNPLQNARPGPTKQNSLRKALVRLQTAGENVQPAPASGDSEAPRGSGGSGTGGAVQPNNGPRSAPPLQQTPASPARPGPAAAAAAAAVAAAGGVRQAQASPTAPASHRLPALAGSSAERPGGLPTGRPSLNDIQREIERMEAQFLQGRPGPGSAGRPSSRRQLSALSNSIPSAPRSYDIQISPGQNPVSAFPLQQLPSGNPGPAPASGPAQMVSVAYPGRER